MKKSFTKVTEFTTIICEQITKNNFKVFTWFEDADEAFATDPKIYKTENDANNEVVRLTNKFASL